MSMIPQPMTAANRTAIDRYGTSRFLMSSHGHYPIAQQQHHHHHHHHHQHQHHNQHHLHNQHPSSSPSNASLSPININNNKNNINNGNNGTVYYGSNNSTAAVNNISRPYNGSLQQKQQNLIQSGGPLPSTSITIAPPVSVSAPPGQHISLSRVSQQHPQHNFMIGCYTQNSNGWTGVPLISTASRRPRKFQGHNSTTNNNNGHNGSNNTSSNCANNNNLMNINSKLNISQYQQQQQNKRLLIPSSSEYDENAMSRLAIHAHGAPLILTGRYRTRSQKNHTNSGKYQPGQENQFYRERMNSALTSPRAAFTPLSVHHQFNYDQISGTRVKSSSESTSDSSTNSDKNSSVELSKSAYCNHGNSVGTDSISVTSDEGLTNNSTNATETCLPRIIKPRKRRKKDKKPQASISNNPIPSTSSDSHISLKSTNTTSSSFSCLPSSTFTHPLVVSSLVSGVKGSGITTVLPKTPRTQPQSILDSCMTMTTNCFNSPRNTMSSCNNNLVPMQSTETLTTHLIDAISNLQLSSHSVNFNNTMLLQKQGQQFDQQTIHTTRIDGNNLTPQNYPLLYKGISTSVSSSFSSTPSSSSPISSTTSSASSSIGDATKNTGSDDSKNGTTNTSACYCRLCDPSCRIWAFPLRRSCSDNSAEIEIQRNNKDVGVIGSRRRSWLLPQGILGEMQNIESWNSSGIQNFDRNSVGEMENLDNIMDFTKFTNDPLLECNNNKNNDILNGFNFVGDLFSGNMNENSGEGEENDTDANNYLNNIILSSSSNLNNLFSFMADSNNEDLNNTEILQCKNDFVLSSSDSSSCPSSSMNQKGLQNFPATAECLLTESINEISKKLMETVDLRNPAADHSTSDDNSFVTMNINEGNLLDNNNFSDNILFNLNSPPLLLYEDNKNEIENNLIENVNRSDFINDECNNINNSKNYSDANLFLDIKLNCEKINDFFVNNNNSSSSSSNNNISKKPILFNNNSDDEKMKNFLKLNESRSEIFNCFDVVWNTPRILPSIGRENSAAAAV